MSILLKQWNAGMSSGINWSSYWSTRWYGIEIDESNSSPDVTRIQGADATGYHATLPVHALLKACLLNDDGTVNYYLDPTDWTKKEDGVTASNLDGTDGQVMIEIPTYYRKVDNPSAKVHQIKICEGAATGFTKVPKFYYSAYPGAVQRSTNKLASVVNMTADYRGGNNNADWDEENNTLLGRRATVLSLTSFRSYARARGAVNWNVETWEHAMLVYELMMIEYATRRVQKDVDATLTVEGYKKGGIGSGVAIVEAEGNTFNGGYPFVPCGASNSLASGSGEVAYTVVGWPGGDIDVNVPRYRGIEMPFSDIYNMTDGVIADNKSTPGVSKLYICKDPNNFVENNITNYTLVGEIPRTNGTTQVMMWSEDVIFPLTLTSVTDNYWANWYFWYSTVEDYSMVLRGGKAPASSRNSPIYIYMYQDGTHTSASLGARLIYLTEW